MKIFLRDQQKNFDALLSDMISLPIADTRGVTLRHQISTTELPPGDLFAEINRRILFEYLIFPPSIMAYRAQWSAERRSMQVGDTILQQVYVPPFPARSQKIVFGVRIDSIIDESGKIGFSYQTLEGHAEKGRSVFTFENLNGENVFRIETFSAPGNLLSKITAPFFARPYQAFCTEKALKFVKKQVSGAMA